MSIITDAENVATGNFPALILRHLPAVIGGVVALGLVMALLATRHTLAKRTDALHTEQAAVANEQAKNAITTASLNQALATIDAKNAETDARAKAYADSKATDAAQIAKLDAAQKADRSRIETLRALARDLPANPACRVPAALTANLEGL